jgi:hypothetical protein
MPSNSDTNKARAEGAGKGDTMSTRCQIGIYKTGDCPIDQPASLVYKHSDGYPEGVLPLLEPFLARFAAARRLEDTEYLVAWLLFEFMLDHRKWSDKYKKKNPSTGDTYSFTGFGICGDKAIHGDIEYYYRVDPDKVQIFRPPDFPDTGSQAADYDLYDKLVTNLTTWKLERTIALTV